MKGFKGFDRDLKCRGFQYEVGKSITHPGKVSLCNKGLHFCENPLDVFDYYDPTQRFAEVEADGVSDETSNDSKRVAKTLHIKAEISLVGMIQCGVKFILDKVDFANAKESNTGDSSAATNTGKEGCAISIGIEGRASGAVGCWLTLAEWKQDEKFDWHRISVKTALVDGKKIKADTFYQLKNGKFIQAS